MTKDHIVLTSERRNDADGQLLNAIAVSVSLGIFGGVQELMAVSLAVKSLKIALAL